MGDPVSESQEDGWWQGVSQWVKTLIAHAKDLSSNPKNLHKAGMAHRSWNPSLPLRGGVAGRKIPESLRGQITAMDQKETLSQMKWKVRTNI